MQFYLDTEFNSFGGELLSLALADDHGQVLYLRVPSPPENINPWVAQHVWPIMDDAPVPAVIAPTQYWGARIAQFLGPSPVIIADWPDDISYLCRALIVGPGMMVGVNDVTFRLIRVDAYPTTLRGAVQHNAAWDALALREKLRA